MDFDRFYVWRTQYAIVEMSTAPIKPETCHRVFAELVEAGVCVKGTDGRCRLVKGVDTELAKRQSRRLMNELLINNQRLVRKLVSQLSKKTITFIEEEDLFQAGCMAFMRSLQSFDPERFAEKKRGASFASYLRHWVRHFVQNAVADQQTIKKPKNFGMPYVIYKRMERIQQETGSRATPEQLGTWKSGKKELPVTQADLDRWLADATSIVSFEDLTFGKHHMEGRRYSISSTVQGDIEPGEIPDSSKSPEDLMKRAELGKKAAEVVASLPPMERLLVEEMREGVFNSATAKRLKVSEEYARQLKKALTEKLERMIGRVS